MSCTWPKYRSYELSGRSFIRQLSCYVRGAKVALQQLGQMNVQQRPGLEFSKILKS